MLVRVCMFENKRLSSLHMPYLPFPDLKKFWNSLRKNRVQLDPHVLFVSFTSGLRLRAWPVVSCGSVFAKWNLSPCLPQRDDLGSGVDSAARRAGGELSLKHRSTRLSSKDGGLSCVADAPRAVSGTLSCQLHQVTSTGPVSMALSKYTWLTFSLPSK